LLYNLGMQDNEALNSLLYKYKFSNFSLEKTIKVLLGFNSISESCLSNERYEEPLKELAYLLVDYKFNKHELTCKSIFKKKLIKWFEDNTYRLTSSGPNNGGGNWGFNGLKYP
jgi:hypothetical protein